MNLKVIEGQIKKDHFLKSKIQGSLTNSCSFASKLNYLGQTNNTYMLSSVCCSTQTKYWIPVLETYWSTITSIAFQKILVQYQYSIGIFNYFPVSLKLNSCTYPFWFSSLFLTRRTRAHVRCLRARSANVRKTEENYSRLLLLISF